MDILGIILIISCSILLLYILYVFSDELLTFIIGITAITGGLPLYYLILLLIK